MLAPQQSGMAVITVGSLSSQSVPGLVGQAALEKVEGKVDHLARLVWRGRADGDHVLIAPPFIIEDAQIHELVSKLSRAVETALAG